MRRIDACAEAEGGRMNYVLGFILVLFMLGLWLAFGMLLPH